MKRWTGCLLVLCLGCSKSDAEKSAPSAPAPAVATQAQTAKDESGDAEAKAIASLKSDPTGKVKAYVVWNQRWLDILKQFGSKTEEYKDKEKQGKFEGLTGAARQAAELYGTGKDIQDAKEKAKAETGLSDAELSALGELMVSAQGRERMQKSVEGMNKTNVSEQIAKLEQVVASAPPEAQEEMKKQIEDMKASLVAAQEMVALKELRAKYGDPVVEAVLAAVPTFDAQDQAFRAATK